MAGGKEKVSDYFSQECHSEILGSVNAKNRGDKNGQKKHWDRAEMWARVGDNADASRRSGKGGKHRGE